MANSNRRWRIFGLRTRAQRGFLVLLITLLAGFNTYYAMTERIIHPTEWFFYTIPSGGIDIRSPTLRSIIEMEWRLPLTAKVSKCSFDSPKPGVAISAIWRDVQLCNTEQFTGDEFEIRRKYFVARVDKQYNRYYREVSERTLTATVLAIGAWLVCLALYGVGLWVMRGR